MDCVAMSLAQLLGIMVAIVRWFMGKCCAEPGPTYNITVVHQVLFALRVTCDNLWLQGQEPYRLLEGDRTQGVKRGGR